MICGTEWDMRNMMPSLQDGDNAAFLRVLPTRGQRAYKMAALPKRWRRGSFFLYNVDVTHKMVTRQAVLPTRWRRFWEFTHKMAALPTRWRLYPQDAYKMATVPRFCEFCPQDGGVHTIWWRYPQDGGFTHKMPTRWRQCRVSASFTTRWRRAYKMVALPKRWWRGSFFPIKCRHYPQDGGFTIRW